MEKDSKSDSSDYGEYADYDDDSSGGFDDDSDNDSGSFGGFEEGSDDGEMLEEPGFTRMTSKQIGREYTAMIIDKIRLFSTLQTKIVEVRDKFEYINLDQGFILEHLRKNKFLVGETCQKLQEVVLNMMDKPHAHGCGHDHSAMQEEGQELMCMIDYMPVEKHNATDLGCGHTICNECWFDYIGQKVKEGMDCIHSKCPVEGCSKTIPLELIDEIADKEAAKM
jgi:hypothetical protein